MKVVLLAVIALAFISGYHSHNFGWNKSRDEVAISAGIGAIALTLLILMGVVK